MKKAFSLVELLIVVAILGIIGAIVLPTFGDQVQKAREANARQNLRIARQQFELFVVHEAIDEMGIDDWPENPFNNLRTCRMLPLEPMPAEATGEYGWILHGPTKTLKLDWPGTDSTGVRYFDY